MKSKIYSCLFLCILCAILMNCDKDQPTNNNHIPDAGSPSFTLFNKLLFFNSSTATVNDVISSSGSSMIFRVTNAKYVTKLTNTQIRSISENMDMEVIVGAACDNYDRIGNVFLSFVEKDEIYDVSKIVQKIEIARFITPFMDKNKSPQEVPYSFEINNIAKILKDTDISNEYDFWVEFDINGLPYAANNEIAGCAGKNYTFFGTLNFISTTEASNPTSQYLVPIACYVNLNNYSSTHIAGETTKIFDINLTSTIKNAKLYLITSNHGANAGGEEYNRRNHNIYFDGVLIDTYKPGGKSCEPFREYNTQANGIYSLNPRSAQEWASFSNWCPGDKIPIRIYELGDLTAGNHKFKIDVPDAEFVGGQGNIPLSVYLQGDK